MAKKLTLEEFKKKAVEKHGNKYSYDKVVYLGRKSKIVITCLKHGDFEQIVRNHLEGLGCKKCAVNQRFLSLKEFKERANKIHNYKYNYDQSIYLGFHSEISIICPVHGKFEQKVAGHLSGRGCKICKNEKQSKRQFYDVKKFINKANKVHNFYYDYSETIYKNSLDKVVIICKVHGKFLQIPSRHLIGNGCIKCAGKFQLNNETFIEKANIVHNYRYDYSMIDYKTAHTKIFIICRKHGAFKQKACSHMRGEGCPKCVYVISKSEIKWLNFLNIPEEYRHQTLKINNKNFQVDAVDPTSNSVYEFYGDYWHGNPDIFNKNEINPISKISYEELHRKTLEKENIIKHAGYNIISIWENDWKKIQKLSKLTCNLSISPSNYFE
jgi:hypothetical protein